MVAPLSLPALGRPQHRDAAACALEPAPRAYRMVSPAIALKPLYRLRPGEKRSKLSAGLAAGPCPHAALFSPGPRRLARHTSVAARFFLGLPLPSCFLTPRLGVAVNADHNEYKDTEKRKEKRNDDRYKDMEKRFDDTLQANNRAKPHLQSHERLALQTRVDFRDRRLSVRRWSGSFTRPARCRRLLCLPTWGGWRAHIKEAPSEMAK